MGRAAIDLRRWQLPVVQPLPKTRGECSAVERPCPHVSCRHHLNRLADHPSCSLAVADTGTTSPNEVAVLLSMSPRNVLLIESLALQKVQRELMRLRRAHG